MPIRARLAMLVSLAVAALVATGGALFVFQLRTGLDASLDTALRARADTLVQKVGPDGNGDFQDSGGGGLLRPYEGLAQVIDPRGRLRDSSEQTRGKALLTPAQLARARIHPLSATSRTGTGEGIRLLAVPVAGSGRPPTVVVVGTSRALTENALNRVRFGLLVGGGLAILLSGVGAWLLAGAALRPVERMRRQAAEMSAGDSVARLAVPATRDEVARLAATMNGLLQRLQEALARQRDFVADAGHELRTPLTTLRAELELAARPGRDRGELVAAVRRATVDTDRLVRLAEDLLTLATADNGQGSFLRRAPVRLDLLAREAVGAAAAPAGRAGVRLVTDGLAAVTVHADRDRLRQVIDNLLGNALRFTPAGGTITMRLARTGPTEDRATLEVLDDGPGFPEAFLPHAFERFRRADYSRTSRDGGTGLGLAIVAALVDAHGGTVSLTNRPDGGACVRVELHATPIAPTSEPPQGEQPRTAPPRDPLRSADFETHI
ncbi:MAG: ATP-binding protein [Actinomycetota bacterium]|nr:ATP-binding protein [Actinomycetota bacterium]